VVFDEVANLGKENRKDREGEGRGTRRGSTNFNRREKPGGAVDREGPTQPQGFRDLLENELKYEKDQY